MNSNLPNEKTYYDLIADTENTWDIPEDEEIKYFEIEEEVEQIMINLGMNFPLNQRSFEWFIELIMLAIYSPNSWQKDCFESIGNRENLTRERVRQTLYKAAWNNWHKDSKYILEKHFGYPVQAQFEHITPNHIEFVELISNELRKKHIHE